MPRTTFPDIVVERTAKKLFEFIEINERQHILATWENSSMQLHWLQDAREILNYAFNDENYPEDQIQIPTDPSITTNIEDAWNVQNGFLSGINIDYSTNYINNPNADLIEVNAEEYTRELVDEEVVEFE